MKCIYCDRKDEMSISDIIPYAITGAKVKRKFVCKKHNSFTNDNYEKIFIANLGMYRNLLGLTERDGSPVGYKGTINIDGYSFENQTITNRKSIVDNKKIILQTKVDEKNKVFIGNESSINRIRGVSKSNIHIVDLSNMSVEKKIDTQECFISNLALHVIAKIAYEWHCYINEIDGYDKKAYENIVSYILNPDSELQLVEIVTDKNIGKILDYYSHIGSNILFEYDDMDGYRYVVFSLWNCLMYRVKICISNNGYASKMFEAFFYNVDGTQHNCIILSENNIHIKTDLPSKGFSTIHHELTRKLGKLNERDISYNYMKVLIKKLKIDLILYKTGKRTFADLVEFGEEDRFIAIFVLELLVDNKTYVNKEKSFQNALKTIIKKDKLNISTEEKNKLLHKYEDMGKAGILCDMIESGINIFDNFVET